MVTGGIAPNREGRFPALRGCLTADIANHQIVTDRSSGGRQIAMQILHAGHMPMVLNVWAICGKITHFALSTQGIG